MILSKALVVVILVCLAHYHLHNTLLGEWRKHINDDIPNKTNKTTNAVFPPFFMPAQINTIVSSGCAWYKSKYYFLGIDARKITYYSPSIFFFASVSTFFFSIWMEEDGRSSFSFVCRDVDVFPYKKKRKSRHVKQSSIISERVSNI